MNKNPNLEIKLKANYHETVNGLLRPKGIVLVSTIFFLHLQLIIYAADFSISENNVAWLSMLSSILLIAAATLRGLSMKNWMLWFSIFYFLLYHIGPVFGMIFVANSDSYIDYPTNFGDGTSEHSRILSYLLSGIAAAFLGTLLSLFPPKQVVIPKNLLKLEKFSFFLWLLSSPFVLVHYIWSIFAFSGNYALSYSVEAKDLVSIVPLHSIFVNIFSIGFFLWFASVPSERRFKKGFYVFIFYSFLLSLSGGRINFIIPLAFIMWYRAIVYDKDLSKTSIYVGVAVLFAFILAMELIRSNLGVNQEILVGFLVSSISKGQYILSLYIDSKELIDKFGSVYWSAPLTFSFDYLLHGSSMVGQGVLSAGLRGDLNHVMSSTLNYEAYISGAGAGSSLVAEAYQYGLIVMFPLLLIFYFFYRELFGRMSHRVIFMISPLLFMHFIFSGRDSLFPNSWGLLKLILAFYIAQYFLFFIRSFSSINVSRNPKDVTQGGL
jgi:hypothetical protein